MRKKISIFLSKAFRRTLCVHVVICRAMLHACSHLRLTSEGACQHMPTTLEQAYRQTQTDIFQQQIYLISIHK